MTTDEGSAKVDALEIVFFGLEVGDLADVVTVPTLVEGQGNGSRILT